MVVFQLRKNNFFRKSKIFFFFLTWVKIKESEILFLFLNLRRIDIFKKFSDRIIIDKCFIAIGGKIKILIRRILVYQISINLNINHILPHSHRITLVHSRHDSLIITSLWEYSLSHVCIMTIWSWRAINVCIHIYLFSILKNLI